jgi:hypothetical protein
MAGSRHELGEAKSMGRDRGRAKAGPDHMLLRGDRGRAPCIDVHPSASDHARLSEWALVALGQLPPGAQLDPEHRIQPVIITPERRSEILSPEHAALIVEAYRICVRYG